jgi:hypothetical protein
MFWLIKSLQFTHPVGIVTPVFYSLITVYSKLITSCSIQMLGSLLHSWQAQITRAETSHWSVRMQRKSHGKATKTPEHLARTEARISTRGGSAWALLQSTSASCIHCCISAADHLLLFRQLFQMMFSIFMNDLLLLHARWRVELPLRAASSLSTLFTAKCYATNSFNALNRVFMKRTPPIIVICWQMMVSCN